MELPKYRIDVLNLISIFTLIIFVHADKRILANDIVLTKVTNPLSKDSDGDTYWDGPNVWIDHGIAGFWLYSGEDKNGNGKYEPNGEDDIVGTTDDESDPTDMLIKPPKPVKPPEPGKPPMPENVLAKDTDKDGLPDDLEKRFNCIVTDADTDDDGVKDGDEVFIYHTNPADPDSDNDSLPDGFELGLTYIMPENKPLTFKNSYNLFWFDNINLGRSYIRRLSVNDQYFYKTYNYEPNTNKKWRSDPNSYDSDYDGEKDLDELTAASDPMRGLIRNLDQYDGEVDKNHLEEPDYIVGWAPVNKNYEIYCNPEVVDASTINWEADLTISLGISTFDAAPTVITLKSSPENTPLFVDAQNDHVPQIIVNKDMLKIADQFNTSVAVVKLRCPPNKVADLRLIVDLGNGQTKSYPVVLNDYYKKPENIY